MVVRMRAEFTLRGAFVVVPLTASLNVSRQDAVMTHPENNDERN